jgi:uncharacterized protein YoxC
MSGTNEEKITMNLKLATFTIALLISILGFFIVRTLNSIDSNIADVKTELTRKSEILGNHETRIQILEKYHKDQPFSEKNPKVKP